MNRQPLSVLLVDAFRDESEMYAEYLRSRGVVTNVCRHPQEALDWLRDRPRPDVVITRMRQQSPMTGTELARQLRDRADTRCVPILMITSSMNPAEWRAAADGGCDKVLLLPLTPDALEAELRELIVRREDSDDW